MDCLNASQAVIGIHQPNFFPWLGYFYKIYKSDIFIFLDDVQFQKKGSNFTNRASILGLNNIIEYLTIPVVRPSGFVKINELTYANLDWRKNIVNKITNNYKKSKYYNKNIDFIISLLENDLTTVCELNINIIKSLCNILNIHTEFKYSSKFNINSDSTIRLIELIKNNDGKIYLSGSGGKKYQDESLFNENDIFLEYINYPNFFYQQRSTGEFISGLSIIDGIFNLGFDGIERLIKKV